MSSRTSTAASEASASAAAGTVALSPSSTKSEQDRLDAPLVRW
jgi:hypothetical protein